MYKKLETACQVAIVYLINHGWLKIMFIKILIKYIIATKLENGTNKFMIFKTSITNENQPVWSRFFIKLITGYSHKAQYKFNASLSSLRNPRSEATNNCYFRIYN